MSTSLPSVTTSVSSSSSLPVMDAKHNKPSLLSSSDTKDGGSDIKKPNALESWPSLRDKLAGRKLAIFLDYDGTLTPIVSNPSDAKITADMTAIVDRLSRRHSTAIVTGRAINTIVDFLPLSHVYYAGSHGFDIRAPSISSSGEAQVKQVASSYLPSLESFCKSITARVSGISGSLVENNKYSISIHYRNVGSDDDIRTIETAIDQLLVQYKDQLKKTHGKKVFEVRPLFDWHKGKAVHWLLTQAFATTTTTATTSSIDDTKLVPIYIGDDVTDEDAFREINTLDFAVGIHVRAPHQARATAASYTLTSIDEVKLLLTKLCDL